MSAELPSRKTWYIILCLAAGLLLVSSGAEAQLTVDGPPTPTAHTLAVWFQQHIPVKFQARGQLKVQPLSDAGMKAYLHENSADPQSSSEGDEDEIDGVFVNTPPQIVLRVPTSGRLDFNTFAHEYGHYVWFDLLTQDDRKHYKALYEKQKSTHHLITEYAADSVEEGFAEAFSAEINDPAALRRQDALSFQFLSRWPAAFPSP